jgi:hypothetical protein
MQINDKPTTYVKQGVRVWVVYLTPKIERTTSLLSASPVGEARCRCRKVWLTRIDYYYYV